LCFLSQFIIPQPQLGRCHRAGTGQTTLEVISSKRRYALNWCKLNNDDDDDDDDVDDDDDDVFVLDIVDMVTIFGLFVFLAAVQVIA